MKTHTKIYEEKETKNKDNQQELKENFMKTVLCKGCGKECAWVKNKKGKWYLANVETVLREVNIAPRYSLPKMITEKSERIVKLWSWSAREKVAMPHICRIQDKKDFINNTQLNKPTQKGLDGGKENENKTRGKDL